MTFSSDHVLAFLAVLDHGSFSAAARHLGRVPSAVSMAMANLEAELGLTLFDRAGREPLPTAAARALEPQARQLADQLQQLRTHALSLSQGLENRLTLAIAPELLGAPWALALGALAREFPLLDVEVLTAPQAEALAMLHSGRAQLALVFERPSLDGREGFQEVSRDTMVALLAPTHPALREAGGRLREAHLFSIRQIAVAGQDPDHHDPRFVFARNVWCTNSVLAALNLITAGLGWGWLPRNVARPHVQAGTLIEIPFENLSNAQHLWVDVVWSRERPLGRGAQRLVALLGARTA